MRRPSIRIYETSLEASLMVASEVASEIQLLVTAHGSAVLGLPTGATPVAVYREWCRMHREEGMDWRKIHTFNLDEYWPLSKSSQHSYHCFMEEQLFIPARFDLRRTNIPSGMVSRDQTRQHCEDYEEAIEKAGGIDIQILGVGPNGHLGFNEPGSPRESRTRLVELSESTRKRAQPGFKGMEVPRFSLTMGLGTILESSRIYLLAFGKDKASAIRGALEGPVHVASPCSFLREHPSVEWVLDKPAALELGLANGLH